MDDDTTSDSRPSSFLSIKLYLLIQTGILVAGFLFGFFLPVPGKMEMLGELAEKFASYKDLSPLWLFLFILANNASKAFILLLMGILLGIPPLLTVISNRYILGIACEWASVEMGRTSMLKAILPHGVLELPALIISMSYGLWLGVVYAKRVGRRDWKGAMGQVRHAVTMYFKIVFPLFIAAALVETVLIASMR